MINKEKELITEALKAIKSGEYIKEFQNDYMESLNNVMLDSNKMELAISVYSGIKENKNSNKLKDIDYYPIILSSFLLCDRYYEELKDKDKKLLVTLSYSCNYLAGINTDDFVYLFSDGELIDKMQSDKNNNLLDNMGRALNSFTKRKEEEDIDFIKKDLILNSSNIKNLEPLFKLDGNIKDTTVSISLDKGVKKK